MKIINALNTYFESFNFLIYFILILCGLGVFRNVVFLSNYHALGQNVNSILIAMIVVYSVQILLILMKQWAVWIVSLIQVIFCISVYPDFSILPLTAIIRHIFFEGLAEGNYAWANFISFMFISFGFSVEIAKTYLLYVYFPRSHNK